MSGTSRRTFLRHSAATLAAPLFLPAFAPQSARAVAPSNRVTVGLIGRGCMGGGHLQRLLGDPGFQVMGVCDVDSERREAGKGIAETAYAAAAPSGAYRGCGAYRDYRELLARPDLDAVLIATPDHWHSLQAIDAAKAGKDVYCEKPVSVTIAESRRLVEVVRRYGRVFQTGTQYRSIPAIRRICRFVREGGLGKIKAAYTVLGPLRDWLGQPAYAPYAAALDLERCGKSYAPLEFFLPGAPVPEGLDWDLWVGPGSWRPYNPVYHRNPIPGVVPWSFDEAFGAAANTWYLSHAADVIQYALGVEESGPVEIIHPGSGQYPTLTCRYANGTLLHLVDHWGLVRDVYHAVPPTARLGGNFGGVFVGERGWLTSMTTGGPIDGGPEEIFAELKLTTRDVPHANNHHANWLECIRTRAKPSAHEEIGHRGACLGHLAMIACRLGRSLKWDPGKEEFVGDEAANRLRGRAMRAPWRM